MFSLLTALVFLSPDYCAFSTESYFVVRYFGWWDVWSSTGALKRFVIRLEFESFAPIRFQSDGPIKKILIGCMQARHSCARRPKLDANTSQVCRLQHTFSAHVLPSDAVISFSHGGHL